MKRKNKILIGTRRSKLALWQASWVKNSLLKNYPHVSVELVLIKTMGDKILDIPLAKVGGKGLFIKEIEKALIEKSIDIAVHSMKDLPAKIPEKLCIGAIPKREDSRDVLIFNKKKLCALLPNSSFTSIYNIPKGARIGTSSLRRSAQLLHLRPDIKIIPVRGNLETRIKKISTQNLDAIMLAAAGLLRLGFQNYIDHYFDVKTILPAVGQGALCIETRKNDHKINNIVKLLDDDASRCVILAERSFLARLEGGCQVPIAANAVLKDAEIIIKGLVASEDGTVILEKTLSGPSSQAEEIGTNLAELLLSFGAESILQ